MESLVRRRFPALALAAAGMAFVAPAEADEPSFYKGYDYGVQALYNPFYGVVNRGWDTLQLRSQRGVQVSYKDTRNIFRNLADPFTAIRYDGENGWGTWLTTEIFPLSYGKNTARWVPNYSLHLLGGGETFAWMREWFLAHDAPEIAAWAFSAAALMTAALINESLENMGVVGYNTDALADIYVFDIGGIVLYSFAAVRRFFSETLVIADWSLQPAITYPTGELHNVGNYYALKVPVPFVPRLKLFAYGGVATLGGVSVKLDREHSLSVAAGGRISTFENTGGSALTSNIVRFAPSAGIFLDRNESLLASVQVSDIHDYFFSANLYPNAFLHTEPGIGAWTAVGKDGRWLAGVSFTGFIGLGIGLGTR
jgi:hypothetical protein